MRFESCWKVAINSRGREVRPGSFGHSRWGQLSTGIMGLQQGAGLPPAAPGAHGYRRVAWIREGPDKYMTV